MNIMSVSMVLVIFRLLAVCVFAGGAVWLASIGMDGWGWCVFAAIMLGCITYKDEVKE